MEPAWVTTLSMAATLAAAGPALAEGEHARTMRAMIDGIAFITRNSGLDYAGQPFPGVTILAEDRLQQQFLAAQGEDLTAGLSPPRRVAALYDSLANQILLSDESQIGGPGLLHELVHFLQHINGKDELFRGHRICLEAEAYEIQALWQSDSGIDPSSMPAPGFMTMLQAACNDADFSWIETGSSATGP